MKDEQVLIDGLRELRDRIPNSADFVESVMEQVQAENAPAVRPGARGLLPNRILGISAMAASVIFLLGVSTYFFGSRLALAQQVQRALQSVETAHVEVDVLDDSGQLLTTGDIWYQAGVGLCERHEGVPTEVHAVNQKWSYRPGDDVALRFDSGDPSTAFMDRLLGQRLRRRGPLRSLNEQREIDGMLCTGYVVHPTTHVSLTDPGDDGRRVIFWINDADLPCEIVSQQRRDGQWRTRSISSIRYNVDVDPLLLLPEFGENVSVLDGNRALEDRYPADSPLASTELGGMRIAIHDLRRCEGGMFFFVTSCHPTAETVERYPVEVEHLKTGGLGEAPLASLAWQTKVPDKYHVHLMRLGKVRGYQFWLTVPEVMYELVDGQRVTSDRWRAIAEERKIDSQEGVVRLPLVLRVTDPRMNRDLGNRRHLDSSVDVPFVDDQPPLPIDQLTADLYGQLLSLPFLRPSLANWDEPEHYLPTLDTGHPAYIDLASFQDGVQQAIQQLTKGDRVYPDRDVRLYTDQEVEAIKKSDAARREERLKKNGF